MAQYDPSTDSVDEVLDKLKSADETEQQAILAAERKGKHRKGVLEPYDIDPDGRVDASGRELYPWEMDPADHVYAVVAEETDEQREWREQQAATDEKIAAATSKQPSATAPGSGSAPAAAGAVAGASTGDVGGTSVASGPSV